MISQPPSPSYRPKCTFHALFLVFFLCCIYFSFWLKFPLYILYFACPQYIWSVTTWFPERWISGASCFGEVAWFKKNFYCSICENFCFNSFHPSLTWYAGAGLLFNFLFWPPSFSVVAISWNRLPLPQKTFRSVMQLSRRSMVTWLWRERRYKRLSIDGGGETGGGDQCCGFGLFFLLRFSGNHVFTPGHAWLYCRFENLRLLFAQFLMMVIIWLRISVEQLFNYTVRT
jgi:hypothetical protein